MAGVTGQSWVTRMLGTVARGQVAGALLETSAAVQESLPVAVTVLLTDQALTGVVKLPVKLLMAPGSSVATVKTGVAPLRLLRTMTLVSVMLPALLTVPL